MKYTLQVSKAHTIYINMFYIFFSKKENFILYQTMKENCNLPSTFLKCDWTKVNKPQKIYLLKPLITSTRLIVIQLIMIQQAVVS